MTQNEDDDLEESYDDLTVDVLHRIEDLLNLIHNAIEEQTAVLVRQHRQRPQFDVPAHLDQPQPPVSSS